MLCWDGDSIFFRNGVFVTTVYALYFRGKDGMYRYSEGMMSTFQIIGPVVGALRGE